MTPREIIRTFVAAEDAGADLDAEVNVVIFDGKVSVNCRVVRVEWMPAEGRWEFEAAPSGEQKCRCGRHHVCAKCMSKGKA